MNILTEIKKAYWLREWNKNHQQALKWVLALELKDYSYNQILISIAEDKDIPHVAIGELAIVLYNRSSRGQQTLEHAINAYKHGFKLATNNNQNGE